MKKLRIVLLAFIFSFSTSALFAQIDVPDEIKNELNESELSNLTKADELISNGDNKLKLAVEEDAKNAKHFEKNPKKGEKKSSQAKIYRIEAAVEYYKAYKLMYSTFDGKLNTSTFLYPQDETTSNTYREEAKQIFTQEKKKLDNYAQMKSADLKKVSYAKMQQDLDKIKSSLEFGVNQQVMAIELWLTQEKKKMDEEAEQAAWDAAVNENTIASYEDYLDKYPNGKFKAQARSRMETLLKEEQNKKKQDYNGMVAGLIYKVQVLALTRSISKEEVVRIYKNEDVIIRYEEGLNKCWVGTFKTYEEARTYRKKVGKGSFVVAFKDGKRITIQEALAISQ